MFILNPFDIVFLVVTIALLKGVIEPVLGLWGNKLTVKYLPELLELADPYVPELLKEGKEKFVEFILGSLDEIAEKKHEQLNEEQKLFLLKKYAEMYSPYENAKVLES